MSRVSYAMMHPEGAGEMTAAVRKALDGLIATLAMRAGIKRAEILELAIVGNPIMHHLVLGIDPTPLGGAPFALATDRAVKTTTAELGLRAHPGARVYLLPCIAGHVGADTAGVILAEQPHQAERMTLVVDVGTNAEIVLGDKHRLLAASSPTGPAFEGAQISGGQRAAPGAIERVRIDRETLEPRIRVIGVDAWSDEPAFEAGVAETGITGICGSGIIEVVAELFLAGVITEDGVVDGTLAARSPRIVADGRTSGYVLHEGVAGGPRIVITQNDVRAIQLAKAALYAGVRLLMDQLEIDAVDEIRLAGAFGSQIDPIHAMILGLVPDCDLANVKSAGNAAGTGALIALLSRRRAARDRGRRPARREDRDRGRAAVPGALRGGDGLPPQDGGVPAPRCGRDAATQGRAGHRRGRPPGTTSAPRGRGRNPGGRLDGRTATAQRRSSRPAGRPTPRARRARAVPDPDADPVRGPRRGGPVAHRVQRGHGPPGGRPRVPRQRRRPAALPRGRRRRDRRARPLPARARALDRPGDRAAPVHAVRAQPGAERRDRRHAHGPRARTTARRSCATSTAAGATAPSRTSATS